jgi:uncharacterized membrane protein
VYNKDGFLAFIAKSFIWLYVLVAILFIILAWISPYVELSRLLCVLVGVITVYVVWMVKYYFDNREED